MISVIICSQFNDLGSELKKNINSTIGCEYQLIIIDNSKNNLSIFEAYNMGSKKAKYGLLVFMHEDIKIHTKDWGNVLISSFRKDSKIGLIGIAGTKIKTTIPSGWWDHPAQDLVINIIQHRPGKGPEKLFTGFKSNPLEEVVVLDGVFFSMRKDERIKFNEFLKGFHNYDQSISLDYRELGYKLCVTNEILIEHFSEGNLNSEWIKSNIKFHHLYKRQLPSGIGKRTVSRATKIFTLQKLINNCLKNEEKKLAIFYWCKLKMIKPLNRRDLKIIGHFLGLTSK
jgi:hypothetical protein